MTDADVLLLDALRTHRLQHWYLKQKIVGAKWLLLITATIHSL